MRIADFFAKTLLDKSHLKKCYWNSMPESMDLPIWRILPMMESQAQDLLG